MNRPGATATSNYVWDSFDPSGTASTPAQKRRHIRPELPRRHSTSRGIHSTPSDVGGQVVANPDYI